MSQALALAVLAGIVGGGLGLTPLLGSLALVVISYYFISLPLMLAGLTMGLTAALIAAVTTFMIIGLIAGFSLAMTTALAFALPAVFVVRQALLSKQEANGLVWYPPGLILAQLSAIAVIALAFAYFALMGRPGGLFGVIEAALVEGATLFAEVTGQAVPDLELLKASAVLVPGILACSWLVMVVINGSMAQAFAVNTGWNRRPSPELSELTLPFWLWPMMAGAVVLSLFGPTGIGLLGRTALIVFMVPFGFLGLAVIHKFAKRWTYRQLGLTAVYAGIIIFGWPFLVVIALGLVEDWAHLRRYM